MTGDIDTRLFRDPPTLRGVDIVLEPLGENHFDDVWQSLQDPESVRMTHTHAAFRPERVRAHLQEIRPRPDRADWAITAADGGAYLGEVVLNELDVDNRSVSFRIALAGPHVFGQGYGTRATRLALDFAFGTVGLHRVSLDVVSYNPRARRVYEKCGFVTEGVLRDAVRWGGEWHDSVVMAVLSTDPRP